MNQRVRLHVLFWLAYTIIYGILNTSFAAPSDLAYSLPIRFLRLWASEILVLPIKIITTYGFLYILIPRYFLKKEYLKIIAWSLLAMIPLVFFYRAIIYYVSYPLLYNEYPSYELISGKRFLYSFLDILPAVAIASTFKLLRVRLSAQKREQELIQEKLQSELRFLKAQTNPHFLFNTLNNIYALARKQSKQTAPVVLKLSEILRYMLYECTEASVSIQKEIAIIKDYIELEQLRYNDRLSVSFKENIDNPNQQIAPLILLPLVENAFKHGTSETRFETFVHIELKLEKSVLFFQVQNPKEESANIVFEKGIGLQNTQRQLELIYPNKHQLTIDNNTNLFSVNLKINLPNGF